MSLAPGSLLIAEPPLWDPNFRRSIILLCEHTLDGSFGLVLNRPAGVRVSEAAIIDLPFDADLWVGGPVQMDSLHVLHPYDDLDGALPVVDGVYWGGDFESMLDGIRGGWIDPNRARFFVGYAGWETGQLDAEIEEQSWLVRKATREMIFSESGDTLWRSTLRKMGGEYALLSTFPDDPRMN